MNERYFSFYELDGAIALQARKKRVQSSHMADSQAAIGSQIVPIPKNKRQ
ncbi:hypothetical protein [Phormidesmis priestleyi]|nr:hypothetical protein [Phormidesmis priestleyi]